MSRDFPLLLLTGALLGGAGCDAEPAEGDPFDVALPQVEVLQLRAPGAEPLEVDTEDGADLETVANALAAEEEASFHALTVKSVHGVNAFLGKVLGLLGHVRRGALETREDDLRVWVREEGSFVRKLAVLRHPDGWFELQLRRRPAAAPGGAPWVLLVQGTFTPGAVRGEGSGNLVLFLDHDLLPETEGKVEASWTVGGGEVVVTAQLWKAHLAPDGRPIPPEGLVWFHHRFPDGSGLLEFGLPFDVDEGKLGPAAEMLKVVSRWNAAGAGRADAVAFGGDLPPNGIKAVHRSQCWREGDFFLLFERTAFHAKGGPESGDVETAGSEADCAFAKPLPPGLPPQAGPEPAPEDPIPGF